MTPGKQPPRLILGVGNLLLRDEGVGVHIISALRDRELPDDVELWDGGTASFDLLDPCLACAVHLVSPKGRELGRFRVS